MKVCVSKFVLGTRVHLIHDRDDNSFMWSNTVPENAWFYGNAPRISRSLNELCLMFNIHPRDKPDDKFVRSFTSVGVPAGLSVPWHMCLPHSMFQKYITGLLEDLWVALDMLNDTTYRETFLSNREALVSLLPARVSVQKLKRFEKEEPNLSQIKALKSFAPPNDEEFLKTPVYQQGGTGRITVKTGPNILTLKKQYRDVIISRFPSGKIVHLDYSSLEPRIMLTLAGKKFDGDVYDFLAKKMSIDLKRAHLKMAVMGSLYGISPGRLQTILGRDIDAASVSDEIKTFFGINSLSRRLQRECKDRKEIKNYYGRPLFFTRCDPHLLVSHYVQSTGVDIALTGFKNIIDYIVSHEMKTVPIFVIHDALLLDMPESEFSCLNKLAEVASVVPNFDCKFPLKASSVSGD